MSTTDLVIGGQKTKNFKTQKFKNSKCQKFDKYENLKSFLTVVIFCHGQ